MSPTIAGGGVLADYRRHLSRGRAKLGDLLGGQVEATSTGCWVQTTDGQRYLNAGGYGVFLHGARHPAVEAAVIDQIRTHPLATRTLLEPQVARAARVLAEVAPPGLTRVHFASSGTEATEAAIKLARTRGHARLISTIGGYHGKTLGALTVTGRPLYQDPFRPLLPQASQIRYGDAGALEAELRGGRPACVIIEPVQGEAGVVIPPTGYLTEVARLCREHGAFLILDEVLTGLGRLGRWWGADIEGITPDALLVGKALSGGIVPVSAVLATETAFRAFDKDPYLHTSTFSGAPIAMAAAHAAVTAISREGLVERAERIGADLLRRLRAAAQPYPELVREVRGVGLLIALELADAGLAGELLIELIERHLLVNHSLNSSTVLRLTPPAVLTPDESDLLVETVTAALGALARRYPDRTSLTPARSN